MFEIFTDLKTLVDEFTISADEFIKKQKEEEEK